MPLVWTSVKIYAKFPEDILSNIKVSLKGMYLIVQLHVSYYIAPISADPPNEQLPWEKRRYAKFHIDISEIEGLVSYIQKNRISSSN